MAASCTSFSTWISWLRVKGACLKDGPGSWGKDGMLVGEDRGGAWGRARMVVMFTITGKEGVTLDTGLDPILALAWLE